MLNILACFLLTVNQYPETQRGDIVDVLHGVKVSDPYRWLEDDVRKNDEVKAWVEAQNELTSAYLNEIPVREEIKQALTDSFNFPRQSAPFERGPYWFQSRNTGLQNHSLIYYGTSEEDINDVLIDPNTFSEDGTKALSTWSISPEGSFLVWGVSDAGSDWKTWRVRSLKNKRMYPEILSDIKFSRPAWLPDESGFYYTRFVNNKGTELVEVTEGSQIWFHKLGTDQSEDTFVYYDKENPHYYYGPTVTEENGWLIVSVNKGTDANNGVLIRGSKEKELRWLDDKFDAEMSYIGAIGDKLWFLTNRDAPNGKIISINPTKDNEWTEVLPERKDILRSADIVGGKMTVTWLQDAASKVTVHEVTGEEIYAVTLPGFGTAGGFGGKNDQHEVYWTYSSFNQPISIHKLNLETQETKQIWEAKVPINLENLMVSRVFVTSTDGARVPMFLTHNKDVKLDNNNPVLQYGYGGFDSAMLPRFSPARAIWVSMGGVYASTCIRGGSEYGRTWHEAGMHEKKQQVFDDFIACSEWLVKNGWSKPSKIGIQGGSNGGLLVGACMTQRPDLFGACLPAVGVMDMLRFHLFTVGWAWTSEYGSPDDPEMFPHILRYSPLHNLKKGVCYPPTLVTTGDTDDRVVPGHSFKFAAELQYDQGCDNPVLIRIETRAGHGAGKPMHLWIDEAADIYAFLYKNLDMGE
mgnify:CR=1 FL=1